MPQEDEIVDNSPLSKEAQRAKRQEAARERLREATERASETVAEYREHARERTDAAIETAAEGMEGASGVVRDTASSVSGVVENAGTKAAHALEQASEKLHEYDTNRLMDEVRNYVREHPLQSAAIAAIGLFLVIALLQGEGSDD